MQHAGEAELLRGGDVGLNVVYEDAILRRQAEKPRGVPEDARLRLAHAYLSRDHDGVKQVAEQLPRVAETPGIGQ